MRSKFHEELKRIAASGTITPADTLKLTTSALALTSINTGPVDLSAGLPSNVTFTPRPLTVTAEYFEDFGVQFNQYADEAVRKQVKKYVAGATIFIAAVKAGINQDPTAMLGVVNGIVELFGTGPDS
jgi:hypothetical protein